MVGYSLEQGLISESFRIDDLFAPSTLLWKGTSAVKG
jgi:hypothetical protein